MDDNKKHQHAPHSYTQTVHVHTQALTYILIINPKVDVRVQEPCESRGGRPGLTVLMSIMVSVDVKKHCTMLRYCS